MVSFAALAASGSENLPSLQSGCEIDYPPFSIVHEDGRADGFSVELMRAALNKMEREVTFRTGPWAEVRGWLERGEVDALPMVGRTPEREELFDFTVPYLTTRGAIVVREETDDVHSLADLRGRRVGVMKGDNAEEFLRREERGFEIVTAPTFADSFRDLAEERCDAVVIQRLVAIRLLEVTGLTNLKIVDRPIREFAQDFCFAVKEGDGETLSILNEGLALVVADGTHRRLHAKWFAQLELPSDRPIIVGGDHHYPPFEFLDENGRPAGFTVELTRAIAREMNMDVRIELGPWADMVDALRVGKIDALEGMFYSPERDRVLDFSPSYLVIHCVSVVRQGEGPPPTTIEDLEGRDLVVQAEDAILDTLAEHGIEARITTVETQEDVVRAVAEGRNACGLGTRLGVLHAIKENAWTNLEIGNRAFYSGEYAYAVPQGSEALLAEFTEGLQMLKDSGEYQRIYEKWLGVYEPGIPVRTVLRYIAVIAGPILLIALLALFWSWSLRGQVAARTRELRESRDHFESVFQVANAGKSITLPTGELNVNNAFANMLGYAPEELRGKTWQELTPPEDVPETERRIAPILDGREDSTRFEKRYVRKDGSTVWADVSVTLLRDAQRRPLHFITTVVDITDRKRAEEALQASESRYRRLFECAKDGILILDAETGEVVDVNPYLLQLLEYDRTAILGMPLWEIGPFRDIAASREAFRVLQEKEYVRYEHLPLQSSTGRLVDVEFVSNVYLVNDRKVIQCNIRDITDRKRAEDKLRESEEYQRAMIACSPVALYTVDLDGVVLTWNQSSERIFGWSADEAIGRPLPIVPEDKQQEFEDLRRRVMEGGSFTGRELLRRRKDGTSIPVDLSAGPVLNNRGKIVAIMAAVEDITERKRAENRIEHLNRVLRAIRDVNNLITHETDRAALLHRSCEILVSTRGYRSAWVALLDAEGGFDTVAESGIDEDFGAVREALECGEWTECYRRALEQPDGIAPIHETSLNCKAGALDHKFRDNAALAGRLRHAGRDYGVLVVSLPAGLADDEEEQSLFRELIGDLAYALHAMETAQQRRQEEARFRTYIENAPYGIFIVDRSGHYLDVNPAVGEITGRSQDELLTMSIADLLPAESRTAGLDFFQGLIDEGRISEEMRFVHKNGEVRHWVVSAVKLSEERFLGFAEDITERKHAEETLWQSRAILRAVLDNIPVRVFWKDRDLNYLGCNLAFARDAGCEDPQQLVGKDDFAMGWREQAEQYRRDDREVIETGRLKLLIAEPQTTPSGETIQLLTSKLPLRDAHGTVVGVLGTYMDVSELKRAEEERDKLQAQLLQAQKMESVGRLAGGVAHDFNNILQVMMGYNQILLDSLPGESEARECAAELSKGVERAAALTRQLLAFARKQIIDPIVIDPNETIESMLKMLRRLLGEDIDLAWLPAGGLWLVRMDPGQVDQILANLCVNARDAIDGVGKVTIETDNVTLDEAYCADHAGFVPGDFVLLAVSDSGCGMDEDTREKIFEPFFTTKGLNEGTGLGLATVYGILKQNQGFINVYSEPGEGTTFKIYLPRHAGETVREEKLKGGRVYKGHGETVLFVEDDASILRLGERILGSMGYDVHAFGAAGEALEFARTKEGGIHLLITDVVMPKMSGRDLAEAMRRICPEMCVLFMSGYTANVIAHRGILDKGTNFLPKPFSREQLAAKVREVLEV